MAQPSSRIITSDMLDQTDYRNQFIEVATRPDDFASADASILLSTVPFLPAGRNFTDIPLYPVGIAQNFSFNEGTSGQMIPEIGSARKISVNGSAMGSGSITRLLIHGNSLVACLYRPALAFVLSTTTLSEIKDRLMGEDSVDWITGLNMDANIDLFSAEMTQYVDNVIAQGGMNSILYKIPFGLIEIKRDMRQRCVAINFLEQCSLRGSQSGESAGQSQLIEQLSFEFERVRPLTAVGPFSLSEDKTLGL